MHRFQFFSNPTALSDLFELCAKSSPVDRIELWRNSNNTLKNLIPLFLDFSDQTHCLILADKARSREIRCFVQVACNLLLNDANAYVRNLIR